MHCDADKSLQRWQACTSYHTRVNTCNEAGFTTPCPSGFVADNACVNGKTSVCCEACRGVLGRIHGQILYASQDTVMSTCTQACVNGRTYVRYVQALRIRIRIRQQSGAVGPRRGPVRQDAQAIRAPRLVGSGETDAQRSAGMKFQCALPMLTVARHV